jgi:hypothetical protein
MTELRQRLARIPDAAPREDLDAAIADSVRYLESDAAAKSLERDVYWPKWHSPWWHMLLLFELGEARRIPARAVSAMVAALDAMPVKRFPLRPDEAPGVDPSRDCLCHCAVGSIDQVLTACGVDVDAALPWFRAWYPHYQMVDGGLSCDDTAYRVVGECPSSMVGTIAPFEAMLRGRWMPEQAAFLERGAAFLEGRKLMLGSSTVHNAEEREAQIGWLAPCFPRFYFYDVLRGLAALVRWAEQGGASLPLEAVAGVVDHLVETFPDGAVRRQRRGFAACPMTWRKCPGGEWSRQPIESFALLEACSAIGAPSAALTRQWTAARRGLIRLADEGRLVG